jgi:hypothetical protein
MTKLLDGMLSPINREAGFSLIEMPDGEIQLSLKFTLMQSFSQKATAGEINAVANKLREEYNTSEVDEQYERMRADFGPKDEEDHER